MRRSKIFSNSLLLLTIPSLVAYPQADIPNIPISPQHVPQSDPGGRIEINNELFSYDDVLDLIEEIEDGDIEERCTPEEIDGINRFVALLAKQGILPGDIHQEFALNRDIEALLSQNDSPWEFFYSLDEGYSIEPAVFYSQARGVLCKSWIKKQWDQTRKFVKHHKKEIIIGAAIVVAVAITVTIVVVVASSSAAATAAGSAIGAAAVSSGDSSQSPPTGGGKVVAEPESQIIEARAIPVNEVPTLKEAIDEQVNEFKSHMAAESLSNPDKTLDPESPSFVQNAREYGAALAHKAFEGASEIVSVVPHVLEEIRDVGERFVPKSLGDCQPDDLYNPLGNYEYAVDKGHQAIDQFFGVDPSKVYSGEPSNRPEFTYGVLPPPSLIGSLVATEGRIAATQASSTGGWRVGQPIQNRTFWGGVPKWSTVRSRYWKNQAQLAKSNPGHDYGAESIPRMERGLAPQRVNRNTGQVETMELHHTPPQREGGLFDFVEVWPQEHALLDPHRRIGN